MDCSASSIHYKESVAAFGGGLDLVRKLRPVTFRWKESGERDFGLIAEEVGDIEPLLTTRNRGGDVQGVRYDRLAVVLINAAKEEHDRADHLQEENDSLRARLERLEAAVQRLSLDR